MDENLTRGYCQIRLQDAAMPDTGEPAAAAGSPSYEAPRRDPPSTRRRDHPAKQPPRHSSPPRDPCSCIYLALLLCGAGFLLPYNSFVTAVDYYHAKFPGSTIVFDISMTYIVVAFVSVVLNNLVIETFRLQTRITFGYAVSFSMLMFIALCDVWFEVFDHATSYRITLVAVATVAVGCTVQQSSFYGYTSMFPPRYTQAVMTGESAAGLLVSINRVVTKAIMPDNAKLNTIIFFIISIATVLLCFIIFHVLRRTEFGRYHVNLCRSAGIADDQRGITHVTNPEEVDILDGNVTRDSYGVLVIQTPTSPTADNNQSSISDSATKDGSNAHAQHSFSSATKETEAQIRFRGRAYTRHFTKWDAIKRGCILRYKVSKNVWPYMMSIGLAYFVTLCLFPGIETEVSSCKLRDWMPIILISVFNLFDFIGKIVASIKYDWPRDRLVMCTLARIILVPLLMLCAAPRDQPILTGEGWPILFSVFLGVTNGYFGSVPMILAPSRVPDEQKELTGNIMTLSYSVGLTTGSVLAYLLDAWLGPYLTSDPCTLDHNATDSLSLLNATIIQALSELPPSEMFPG